MYASLPGSTAAGNSVPSLLGDSTQASSPAPKDVGSPPVHLYDALQAGHRAVLRRLLRGRFGACGPGTSWDPVTSRITSPERVYLGSNVFIGPYAVVSAAESISIGDDTVLGPGLTIMTGNHRYNQAGVLYREIKEGDNGPVVIGRNVWAAARVTILRGVTVGDSAIIAAGAVVTHDVSPFQIVGGVPARHLRWRFEGPERERHQIVVDDRLTRPEPRHVGPDGPPGQPVERP